MGRRERERQREREGERERRREREKERDCVLSGEWRCEGLEGKVKKQEKLKKEGLLLRKLCKSFCERGLFRDGPDQGHVHVNASRDSPLAKNG